MVTVITVGSRGGLPGGVSFRIGDDPDESYSSIYHHVSRTNLEVVLAQLRGSRRELVETLFRQLGSAIDVTLGLDPSGEDITIDNVADPDKAQAIGIVLAHYLVCGKSELLVRRAA